MSLFSIYRSGLSDDECRLMAEIHAAAFETQPWDAEAFRQLAKIPATKAYVAWEGERAVGFLLVSALAGGQADILTLAVQPEFRRRGAARALLQWACGDLAIAGVKEFLLEVAENNAAALRLYAGEGFKEITRRKAYYQARPGGPSLDAVVMRKILLSASPSSMRSMASP